MKASASLWRTALPSAARGQKALPIVRMHQTRMRAIAWESPEDSNVRCEPLANAARFVSKISQIRALRILDLLSLVPRRWPMPRADGLAGDAREPPPPRTDLLMTSTRGAKPRITREENRCRFLAVSGSPRTRL